MTTNKYNCDISQLEMESFEIDRFNVYNDVSNPVTFDEIGEYGYNLEVGIGYNLESKLVRVILDQKIEIFEKKKSKPGGIKKSPTKKAGGDFSLSFLYTVSNLEECLVENENNEEFLEQLLSATLIGLSYSTSRGIIKTKSANTILEDAMLPILNPWDMVPEE